MPAGFGMRPWLHAILVKKQVLWCQGFPPIILPAQWEQAIPEYTILWDTVYSAPALYSTSQRHRQMAPAAFQFRQA